MWVLLPVKFGIEEGGGGDLEKNVRTCGKNLATPLISPSAFAICVSAVNINFVFDHFLLDFQWCESFINMMIWATPKNQTAPL